MNEYVEFTGWIPRWKLYALYQGADAFITPSLFEGFGLPLLEALAAGIPTACSAIPPFHWVGGNAVQLFDPHDDRGILEALERVSTDPDFRSRAAVEGPAQARRFDWNDSAAQTLAALKQAAHER